MARSFQGGGGGPREVPTLQNDKMLIFEYKKSSTNLYTYLHFLVETKMFSLFGLYSCEEIIEIFDPEFIAQKYSLM